MSTMGLQKLLTNFKEIDREGWKRGIEEALGIVADHKKLFTELAEEADKRGLQRQRLQRRAVASACEMLEVKIQARLDEPDET